MATVETLSDGRGSEWRERSRQRLDTTPTSRDRQGAMRFPAGRPWRHSLTVAAPEPQDREWQIRDITRPRSATVPPRINFKAIVGSAVHAWAMVNQNPESFGTPEGRGVRMAAGRESEGCRSGRASRRHGNLPVQSEFGVRCVRTALRRRPGRRCSRRPETTRPGCADLRSAVFLRPLHTTKGEVVVSAVFADDSCPVSPPALKQVTVRQSRVTVNNSRG